MKKRITLSFIVISVFITTLSAQSWNQLGNTILGTGNVNLLGHSTAISGDGTTAAIGAPKLSSSGQVQIYTINDTGYTPKGAPISGLITGENFGWSISISQDGNTVVIGAPLSNTGRAYIYNWDGSSWTPQGSPLNGINGDDQFGWDVDISSDANTIAISAPLSDQNDFNAGSVTIYKWENGDWISTSDLFGAETRQEFGKSIALNESGDVIVIGSPFFFGSYNTGLTGIYALNSGQWLQQGDDIFGLTLTEHLGFAVDINNEGNRIAAGAFSSSEGKVRVFDWNGLTWDQIGEDIKGDANFDSFGYSLSLNGDGSIVAAGAPSNDANGSSSGHAKIYKLIGNEWTARGQNIEGIQSQDNIGTATALSDDGNKIAIGGSGNTNNGDFTGRAILYSYTPTTSTQQAIGSIKLNYGPNPTSRNFNINFDQTYKEINIEIQSITGHMKSIQTFANTKSINLDLDGNTGWYILNIKIESNIVKTIKVFKSSH